MLLIKKWWQKRSGDECQVTLTSKLPSARLLRLYFYASSARQSYSYYTSKT